jgi:hypothetical protein
MSVILTLRPHVAFLPHRLGNSARLMLAHNKSRKSVVSIHPSIGANRHKQGLKKRSVDSLLSSTRLNSPKQRNITAVSLARARLSLTLKIGAEAGLKLRDVLRAFRAA